MPRMSGNALSVAANSVSANVLAGQLYEFLRRGGPVLLSGTGSAAGLKCTFIINGQVVINDADMSSANRFPIVPDDVITQEGARAGSRLILTFRNSTGAALNAFWAVDVP